MNSIAILRILLMISLFTAACPLMALAQQCPMPYFIGAFKNSFYLDLPIPSGALPNGESGVYPLNIWSSVADNSIGTLFPILGQALPNSSSNPFTTVADLNTDSVHHGYFVQVSFKGPVDGFKPSVNYAWNRTRTAQGVDQLAVARFGAANPADNFLLKMPLVLDAQGDFDLAAETECKFSTTPQNFDRHYLRKSPPKPLMVVAYQGDYFPALFYNSLHTILSDTDLPGG